MPPWQKQLDERDAYLELLRFKQYCDSRMGNKTANGKGKGKGKSRGSGQPQSSDLGTGLDLTRPLQRDEPLYAGRTEQEVSRIISSGGWVGKRQYGKYKGKVFTSLQRDGDLTCSRCRSATCRPFRSDCWVCGAPLLGGGKAKDHTKNGQPNKEHKPKEPSGSDQGENDDDYLDALPKAADMASVKRRPPSTATTVLAGASLAAAPSYAEVVGASQPAQSPSPPPQPSANPAPAAADPDLLDGATLGQVKALVAKLPAAAAEKMVLVKLLEKHVAAEARHKRQDADAKAEAVDFTGWTLECVLAHRETRLAAAKKRLAENSARCEVDQESRRQAHRQDRVKLQKAVDTAVRELKEFDDLTALRSAEWEAAEKAKAADLKEQIERAEEEVARAKAALLAAPAPNTKLGPGGAPEAGKETDGGAGKGEEVAMEEDGRGKGRSNEPHTRTPNHFLPMITPPKPQPPTDPHALGRLHQAQAVHQLWSVQEGDWPLTPAMLGLSIQELAQLVGEEIWSRSPFVSDHAPIRKSLAGSIAMALNGLEVSAAAQAAAQGAARQMMEAHQTALVATRTAEEDAGPQPPPNKQAKTDADAGEGTDVEM